MNIGLYITSFASGGAERVVSRLSSILHEHGHNVFVIISDTRKIAYPVEGALVDLNLQSSNSVFRKVVILRKRVSKLKKIKKEYGLESVISFLDGANIVNVLARVNKSHAFVSIRNHHSSEINDYDRRIQFFHKLLMGFIYRRSTGVICVSKLIASDIYANYNVPQNLISVLYNPYNIDEIQRLSRFPTDQSFRNFKDAKTKLLCSTGRLQHQKGFWHLLKIFSLLNPEQEKLGLVIIGDGEQQEKISGLAKSLGIEESIYFAGYQANPFPIIANCELYVLSSLFEGFPNAMVEAMCLGLPISAADCQSGPREILAPELEIESDAIDNPLYASYGLLMPPLSNAEDWSTQIDPIERLWAAEIMKWVENSDRLSSYANKSVERAREFSDSSCLNKLLEIIKSDE